MRPFPRRFRFGVLGEDWRRFGFESEFAPDRDRFEVHIHSPGSPVDSELAGDPEACAIRQYNLGGGAVLPMIDSNSAIRGVVDAPIINVTCWATTGTFEVRDLSVIPGVRGDRSGASILPRLGSGAWHCQTDRRQHGD